MQKTVRQSVFYLLFLSLLGGLWACQEEENNPAPPPVAQGNFAILQQDSTGAAEVAFTHDARNATSYFWDFGDGNTSEEAEPTHMYEAPGLYEVHFLVRGEEDGQRDAQVFSVDLRRMPHARFEVEAEDSVAGTTLHFLNSSRFSERFFWDFGDGTQSTLRQPTHAFAEAGTYTVKLRAENALGRDEAAYTVRVVSPEAPPVIAFEISNNNCVAECEVGFANLTENALEYHWDFGDGNQSTAESPTHNYEDAGLYTVRLTATNEAGRSYLEKQVRILQAPEPDFVVINDGCTASCTMEFVNLSEGADEYIWSFGDGGSSTDEAPTHYYTTPGTYTVTLTAIGLGGVETVSKQVTVAAPPTPPAGG